jgi:hypothetical protein
MRKKISTIVEQSLYRRLKLESARQGRPLNEILTEAVEKYLTEARTPGGGGSVVDESWATFKLDRKLVKRILDEEPDALEARWHR